MTLPPQSIGEGTSKVCTQVRYTTYIGLSFLHFKSVCIQHTLVCHSFILLIRYLPPPWVYRYTLRKKSGSLDRLRVDMWCYRCTQVLPLTTRPVPLHLYFRLQTLKHTTTSFDRIVRYIICTIELLIRKERAAPF
jgi:hypothetical protein